MVGLGWVGLGWVRLGWMWWVERGQQWQVDEAPAAADEAPDGSSSSD